MVLQRKCKWSMADQGCTNGVYEKCKLDKGA